MFKIELFCYHVFVVIYSKLKLHMYGYRNIFKPIYNLLKLFGKCVKF